MKFYRPLGPIKAITFDLDDTLYDNYPVIRKTTAESHAALQAYHPALREFTPEDYQALRDELLLREPEIYHDVSEWRRRSVELALLNAGLPAAQASAGARDVMSVFHQWRSAVEMPEETHQTLTGSASACRWWRSPMATPTRKSSALITTSSSRCAPVRTAAPSRGRICTIWPPNGWALRRSIFCTSAMT